MDRSIEPTLEEKVKARKSVVPFLYDIFKGVDKVEVSDKRTINNYIDLDGIKKAMADAIGLIKIPAVQKVVGEVKVTNQKEVQKVEVTNQKEIKIEKTVVNFPELQKVAGEVTAVNLPIGTQVEPNSKNADPSKYLVVRLTDGTQFYSATGGAISAPMGRSTENIYLREEYSYTTVSGSQVPVMVKKWTDNMVLTETYEYDANANPIKKFRSIEPYNA